MKLSIFVTALVIYSNSICLADKTKFHETLSQEDLKNIFHVETIEEVPEYHITSIHSRVRRSTQGSHTRTIHLNAFGEKKLLNLEPNELLSKKVPVFFADTQEGSSGVTLTPVQSNPDVGIPYQDENTMAAVLVTHHPDSGALLLDGTIGEDLVVRPIPASLAGLALDDTEEELSENRIFEDEAFLDDGENLEDDLIFSDGLPLIPDDDTFSGSSILSALGSEKNETRQQLPDDLLLLRRRRSATTQGLHVVYKRKVPSLDTDFALMESDDISTNPEGSSSRRSKREAPQVIYPEILVLVDYDGYLLHGQDNSKIKSYYVSFWNGADLRYKLLKSPKVKVSIAGIIISRSRDAMPYLERNRVGRDAIDSASALTDMGKYLYQERRLPTYDVAVAITKYDLCRRRQSGTCTTGTAGFAYVGGACVVNKRLKKVNSVAIVEDTGGFSGIIVAAHEVGHLLGAVHDGSPPPSYLGGPGARRCRWKDGYIMSDLRHTEKGFRWSPCSIEQFHHFLNGETATCLYNLPHEDESLPRILPGKLMSLDAQCRKDRGTSACFKDERVCAQLFCFDKSSGYCVSYRPAAEGSNCGDGKVCLNGKCVYDDDNSITDHDVHREVDNKLYDSTQPQVVESRDSSVTETWKQKRVTTTTLKTPTTHITTTPTPTTTLEPTTERRHLSVTSPPTTKPQPWQNTKSKRWSTTTKSPATSSTSPRPTTSKFLSWRDESPSTVDRTTPSTSTSSSRTTSKGSLPTQKTTTEPSWLSRLNKKTWRTTKNPVPETQMTGATSSRITSTTPTTPYRRSTTHITYDTTTPKTTDGVKSKPAKPTFKPWPVTSRSANSVTEDSTKEPTTTRPFVHKPWTRWLVSSTTPRSSFWDQGRASSTSYSTTQSTIGASHVVQNSPVSTTERSNWWKNNNKWKQNKTTPIRTTTTSTTITTKKPTTTTTTTTRTPIKPKTNRISISSKNKQLNVFGHGFKCEDFAETIAGSMSCKEFLKSYGLRYCNHRYIQKNCCKSRSEICT